MGLFNKLFKRDNKKIKHAINDINEELFDKELTPKEDKKLDTWLKEQEVLNESPGVVETEIIEELDSEPEETLLEEIEIEKEPQEIEKEVQEVEQEKIVLEPKVEEESITHETKIEDNLPKEKLVEKIDTLEETIEVPTKQEEQTIEETSTIDTTGIDTTEEEPIVKEESLVIADEEEQQEEAPKKKGLMKRLFSGLSKTRDTIAKGVDNVLSNFKQIDEELYEELEEALIMADFGVDTTLHIMEELRKKVKAEKITDPLALKPALQAIITEFLTSQPVDEVLSPTGPTIVLVIGVNGVGKTTSIGKMAHLFKSQDKKVLVAAADTFRAAAIEQLNVWTERADVEIIKHSEGSDAAAVVFDAVAAAKSRKADVLICDTAGRLQNKTNLMKELEKISRVISREYPEAKKESLIVIDATTGQNALQQVKLFKEVADINGIILTKLDGTAKGGAIVSIYDRLKVPVKYIGVGEKIDDLQPFDAAAFAKALFDMEE